MSDKKGKVPPPFVHSETQPQPVETEEPKPVAWAPKQFGAFDWRSAASLRAAEKPGDKAERAWDSTDWEDLVLAPPDEARRVAEQIDAVAQKIRNGELTVDGKSPTPETAMAAALEALIRAK